MKEKRIQKIEKELGLLLFLWESLGGKLFSSLGYHIYSAPVLFLILSLWLSFLLKYKVVQLIISMQVKLPNWVEKKQNSFIQPFNIWALNDLLYFFINKQNGGGSQEKQT